MFKKFISISLLFLWVNINFLTAHDKLPAVCKNDAIEYQADWGNLFVEGQEIDLKAAELAHSKLKGGHYDPQLHAVIPADIEKTEKEWKKAKDHIASLIGPLPSFTSQKYQKWENSSKTIDDLLRDARLMAPSFKKDFRTIATSIGASAYFGPEDRNIIKTRESLISKVKRDAIELELSEEEATTKISDALRGTIIVDNFFQVHAAIAEIAYYADRKGAQIIFKNLWKEERESGYVGIHAKILLPLPTQKNEEQSYILAEMQIHFRSIEDGTSQSTKEHEHSIYEQVRAVKSRSKEVSAASKLLFLTAMQEILYYLDE